MKVAKSDHCLSFRENSQEYSMTFSYEIFQFGFGTKRQCLEIEIQYFVVSIFAGALVKVA